MLFSRNTIAEVFPQILNFASQEIGTTSEIQEVFVASEKNNMTINNIVITGDFTKTTSCKGVIEIGDKCSIRITFSPTSKGWHQETLTITSISAGKNKTDTVFIEGIGFYGEIPNTAHLINISTRAPIQGGANDVIAGFIITGTGTQKVIIRGLSLDVGIDPNLLIQTYPEGKTIADNNNWQSSTRANEIATLPKNLRLNNPTDAGLLLDLSVGAYTVILSSLGTKGLGLIGVDAIESSSDTAKLINISSRAPIQGGANDVIAGFIITGTGMQKVILRGFAIETGVNPKLTLHKYPSGELVASNDNWQTDSRASEVATLPAHLKLKNPTDAGLLLDLPVGAYTVILSSVGTKGLGLVGIDAID